jgi:hypothetical protein
LDGERRVFTAFMNLVIKIDNNDYLIDLIPTIKNAHLLELIRYSNEIKLLREKLPLIKDRLPEYADELEKILKKENR